MNIPKDVPKVLVNVVAAGGFQLQVECAEETDKRKVDAVPSISSESIVVFNFQEVMIVTSSVDVCGGENAHATVGAV
jgi:hypothetical protein